MSALHLSMAKIQSYLPGVIGEGLTNELAQKPIPRIVTDSRSLEQGDFFVALLGENFDGHDFLSMVAKKGAIGSLISQADKVAHELPYLVVKDTKQALGQMAMAWRKDLGTKVVVVTGSNGKTTVKEMIASIFRQAVGSDHVLSTQGNLNNDIGLPLTLLRLRSEHQLAVVELGMNHPGETDVLAQIATPNIALINNAQREHQEFMQTVEAVANEHALAIKALPSDGVAVFPHDSEFVDIWYAAAGDRPVVTFAFTANPAKPIAEKNDTKARRPNVAGRWNEKGQLEISATQWTNSAVVNLRTLGNHNARNALAATAVSIAAGVSKEAIIQGLESFEAVNGRMKKVDLPSRQPITLIDDTYNANPDSVIAAINAIAALQGEHWLVLGDMGEVGDQGPAFHQEIGEYAALHGIDQLLTIGELTRYTHESYGKTLVAHHKSSVNSEHFVDMAELTEQLTSRIETFENQHQAKSQANQPLVVLVKGSRFTRMERVVEALLKKEISCS